MTETVISWTPEGLAPRRMVFIPLNSGAYRMEERVESNGKYTTVRSEKVTTVEIDERE